MAHNSLAVPMSDSTAANLTAWAAGRAEEAQSATFRALAWSQEDDSLAEPLPYIGDLYRQSMVPQAPSGPTVRDTADAPDTVDAPDTADPPAPPRYSRSTLLFGIATGFAAAAVGGLLLTGVNLGEGPTPISNKVNQPATNAVNPQPNSAPIQTSLPAPANTAADPAHVISSTVAPARAVATPVPEAQKPALLAAVAPEVAAPEAGAPGAPAPEAVAPAAATAATPEFTPPGTKPPVWVPPVAPQTVPHPVGPSTSDVPDIHLPAVTDFGIPAPVVPAVPAAPEASNPVLTVEQGFVIPAMMPAFSKPDGQ